MRIIGYVSAYFQNEGEFSMVKKIRGNEYPRFHLYIKPAFAESFGEAKKNSGQFIFSLHLDQKKPSYEGSHAHSGDYEGDVVKGEAERIKKVLAD